MESQSAENRSETKRRLLDRLRIAVGGLVVAAATVSAVPTAGASTTTTEAPKPTIEERVTQLQQQLGITENAPGAASATLAAFSNWGNHWNNWHNWHNWANWHNH